MAVKISISGKSLGDVEVVVRDKLLLDRVQRLLDNLPVLDERRQSIAEYEAANLCLTCHIAKANDLPRSKRAGSVAAKRALKRFAELAYKLRCHIATMPRDALDGMEADQTGDVPHPLLLDQILKKSIHGSYRAYRGIADHLPAPGNVHSKGRARLITLYCANLFERLTGKPARRHSKSVDVNYTTGARDCGPFLDFLGEVFYLFEVNAKPAGQLKLLEKGGQHKPS